MNRLKNLSFNWQWVWEPARQYLCTPPRCVSSPRRALVTISSAEDLHRVKRLALAEPKTVPAGIYAKEFLTKKNLWPELAPKVISTDNVRAALTAVESGNVEAGIVYKTDAAISKKVKVAYEVSPKYSPGIS